MQDVACKHLFIPGGVARADRMSGVHSYSKGISLHFGEGGMSYWVYYRDWKIIRAACRTEYITVTEK